MGRWVMGHGSNGSPFLDKSHASLTGFNTINTIFAEFGSGLLFVGSTLYMLVPVVGLQVAVV